MLIEKIPEAAFRETIANALIHRAWDVESQIRVLMFDDRIEIVSPGGLPSGITEKEYLSGKLSVLRNKNLANVFYRLGFVEIFGTGITRIKQIYEDGLIKPDFEVSENAPYVPFGKSKTAQLLKALEQKGIVIVEGKGRGTKYRVK